MNTPMRHDILAQRGQPYGPHPEQLCDVYQRAHAAADAPLAIVVHGGGWQAGHRNDMEEACLLLAERGFVAMAPSYRLIGAVSWPTPLQDVRLSLRAAAHSHPAARIFVVGFSAGAHLGLLAPTSCALGDDAAPRVDAIAAFFPPAWIGAHHARLIGVGPEAAAAIGPVHHAGALPPTIILSGDRDSVTPPDMAVKLHRAVLDAGGTADLRLLAGMPHEYVGLPGMKRQAIDDVAAFFERVVAPAAGFTQALADLLRWQATI